jgi:ATP-dependent protease ClpP protease subunit
MFEKQSKGDVVFITHNIGLVASMGCYVFLAGQKRYSTPNGQFLFHAASDVVKDAEFNVEDLEEMLKDLQAKNDYLLSLLNKTTNISYGEAETLVRREVIFRAKDALRDGIISDISEFVMSTDGEYLDIKGSDDKSLPPVKGDFSKYHLVPNASL